MQNAFPHLLSFALLSPFILRLFAGGYFSYFGYQGLTTEWYERSIFFEENRIRPARLFATATALGDLAGGALLMMGFETQVVALALAIVCLTAILVKAHGESFPRADMHIYILLGAILVSLVISGAGFYAMDLSL